MVRRSAAVAISLCLALPATALAQPVPVLTLSVGDRPAAPAARLAAAVPDALHGDALAQRLRAHFGRAAPEGDPLRAQREELRANEGVLFSPGRRGEQARRRVEAAVDAMAAAPDALELDESNRAVYLRALLLLAATDAAALSPTAEAWMRRMVAFDPHWTPSASDAPDALRARYERVRGAATGSPGRLEVTVTRPGCAHTIDGAPPAAELRPGVHRVAALCGARRRVRFVVVPAGATASVTVDPRLDDALAPDGLRYADARDAEAHALDDARALARALGATRAVLVSAERARVLSAAGTAAELPLDASDLDARLRAALSDAPSSAPPRAPSDAPRRGPGAAPWVVAGLGAAAAVAGAALLAVSVSEADAVLAGCATDAAGVRECDALDATSQPRYDAARAMHAAGWSLVGVGGAALAAGALWYALAPRGAPVATAAVTRDGAALVVGGRF